MKSEDGKARDGGVARWLAPLALGLIGGVVGGGGMMLVGASAAPATAQVETVVHDYLLNNPEILPEAMDRLRAKQNAALVVGSADALRKPFAGAWKGAANGDVVLVEFTDYNCGYCRASMAVVDRLVAEDPKLKVVFREFPILSQESVVAARAALAAAGSGQPRYAIFHSALFNGGRVSPATIEAAYRKAGIDPAAAGKVAESQQVTAEIQSNHALAGKLGFNGTPAWVVGDQVLQGAVGYDALKAAIAQARAVKAKKV